MTEFLSLDEDVENHFGFRETPFGVTPDPRFFYSNPVYVKALAALVYGIKAKKGVYAPHGGSGDGQDDPPTKTNAQPQAKRLACLRFPWPATFYGPRCTY